MNPTLKQLDVAIWDSITGNGLVVSPRNNVTIRINANPMRASYDTQEESKGKSMINSVIAKQRKAFDTLSPKRQVDRKQYSDVTVSLLVAQPEDSGLLKVSLKSDRWNMVNPVNPALCRKDWAEDTRKSECHSVMEWIEMFGTMQTRYSTGNGAHFWLVLLIGNPEIKCNQRRC
jgi:hypothetical protein